MKIRFLKLWLFFFKSYDIVMRRQFYCLTFKMKKLNAKIYHSFGEKLAVVDWNISPSSVKECLGGGGGIDGILQVFSWNIMLIFGRNVLKRSIICKFKNSCLCNVMSKLYFISTSVFGIHLIKNSWSTKCSQILKHKLTEKRTVLVSQKYITSSSSNVLCRYYWEKKL